MFPCFTLFPIQVKKVLHAIGSAQSAAHTFLLPLERTDSINFC